MDCIHVGVTQKKTITPRQLRSTAWLWHYTPWHS